MFLSISYGLRWQSLQRIFRLLLVLVSLSQSSRLSWFLPQRYSCMFSSVSFFLFLIIIWVLNHEVTALNYLLSCYTSLVISFESSCQVTLEKFLKQRERNQLQRISLFFSWKSWDDIKSWYSLSFLCVEHEVILPDHEQDYLINNWSDC
jgi:hypothetical protein